MPDRTIILAQNGRHGLRGVSAINPQEFEAYHDDDDALTYVVDATSYLGGDTLSTVTRTPSGVTVSNESNTTTTFTQRLAGTGYVDLKFRPAGGDTESFRLHIRQRVSSSLEAGQAAEVPDPMAQTYTDTRDPTANDDSADGHWVGRFWLNRTSGRLWVNKSNTASAAVWLIVTNDPVVNALDYGVKADGVTEDHAALQAAIAGAVALGGGVVQLPAGTILIGSTVTLYSKVILRGSTRDTTVIKAKNGFNSDMLKTLNYASLTGQNKYLAAEGVQYGFGLESLRLEGNSANQSSGNGLVVYGKNYTLRDIIIRDVKEIGWISEAWFTVGTATYPEQPESHYENVDVQGCGSHGIRYRGPTDAHWESVFVHQNVGWGIRLEADGATYNCASDLHFAHVYANTAGGVFVGANTRMRFGHMATESNFGAGLEDTSTGGTTYDFLESYINARTTGTAAIVLSGSNIKVNSIFHTDGGESVNGVEVTGTRTTIDRGRIKGDASTGTGIVLQGTGHRINCDVEGYSGVGGKGIQSGNGGTALTRGYISADISDCKTGWSIQTAGVGNILDITVAASSGQTALSAAFSATERGTCAVSDTVSSYAFNINAPTLLQQSAVAVSHTGNTSETALATISVPGNMMGPNGQVTFHTVWTHTNSANTKNARLRIGGIGGTVCMNYTTTTTATLTDLRHVANRNSAASQTVSASNGGQTGGFGTTTSGLAAPVTDTAANFDFVLSGQLGNSGETITLESYRVELIRA